MIDGLLAVIDEHVATVSKRREPMPAALGCVPWLTDNGIAERLARLEACCVVVDKGHQHLAAALGTASNGFPNVLPRLRNLAPLGPDGKVPIIGPYTPEITYTIGPVRAVGVSDGERSKPLLHAKLLVLGRLVWVEIGPDEGPTMEELVLEPWSVWWGSANWIAGSRSHLELGVWSDDAKLAREATDFLDDLIAFSEPLVSVARDRNPIWYPRSGMKRLCAKRCATTGRGITNSRRGKRLQAPDRRLLNPAGDGPPSRARLAGQAALGSADVDGPDRQTGRRWRSYAEGIPAIQSAKDQAGAGGHWAGTRRPVWPHRGHGGRPGAAHRRHRPLHI